MHTTYNEKINLNYLRIFNAIYQARSTTIAAKKLGVTQSAVSQTLAKLRAFTGDRLFYSANNELAPTQRAIIINEGLNENIQAIDDLLLPVSFFEPEHFHGELTVAVSSVFLESFATEFTTSVIFESLPNAKINVTTWTENTMKDIIEGRVHMAMNFDPISTPKSIRCIPLTQSQGMIVARKDHPWVTGGMLQAEFNQYPLGGCLLPDTLESESLFQSRDFKSFDLKYRSASMSVLNCLAKHSDILALTETLSASVCDDDMVCIQPQWLNDKLPNKINHAFYYLEKNHHVPLYKFSADIIKKVIEDKLNNVLSRTVIVS
ncbi:LysR family transcriptional regulator [Moritella sp. Urea-trap-13]|uniref:LysR family transcriptional regulator n=1 Tax=Moritella sp. Urea-trap-13 TaxID=2058327 RepID=UPI000C327009|nr:LysR family transcriptional regulator [Moritella sp. Urea-trap-13]PKH07799.1 LysR family transcriptional regulator [Moritella sp. Urea-trap-13]